MKNFTFSELIVLENALKDYSCHLRERANGSVMSETEFLASDFSQKRKENYLTTKDLLMQIQKEKL